MFTTRARKLRNNPTEVEHLLWQHLRLRQLGGYKFRRQQPLGPYVVDFICLEKRLVVEVDGGQHNQQTDYEAERSSWLETQGFHVLRFWNYDILQSTDAVKETIAKALGCFVPPP